MTVSLTPARPDATVCIAVAGAAIAVAVILDTVVFGQRMPMGVMVGTMGIAAAASGLRFQDLTSQLVGHVRCRAQGVERALHDTARVAAAIEAGRFVTEASMIAADLDATLRSSQGALPGATSSASSGRHAGPIHSQEVARLTSPGRASTVRA
jgi:hypothetical protein